MAVDYFLELDGIKGETADKVYKSKGALDILSWSWGLSNPGAFHIGSGGGTSKANFNDLTFMKYLDKASCGLMDACASGKHIPKAVLTARKASGDKAPLEYLKITCESAFVTSYQVSGSGSGGELPTESFSLNFKKVKVEYNTQTEKGTKEAGGQMSWDIAANTKD